MTRDRNVDSTGNDASTTGAVVCLAGAAGRAGPETSFGGDAGGSLAAGWSGSPGVGRVVSPVDDRFAAWPVEFPSPPDMSHAPRLTSTSSATTAPTATLIELRGLPAATAVSLPAGLPARGATIPRCCDTWPSGLPR